MSARTTFEEYRENPTDLVVFVGIFRNYYVRAHLYPMEAGVEFRFVRVDDYSDRRNQYMACNNPEDFMEVARALLDGDGVNWDIWEDGNGNAICPGNATPEED